jgi:hypothetical protein
VTVLARVCLACRTAYASGDACDGGDGHDVVTLDDPMQRQRMVEMVWGDREERRRTYARVTALQHRARRMVLGTGAAGLVAGTCLGTAELGMFVAFGGSFVAALAAHVSRPRDRSAYPVGARSRPWPQPAARGTVRAAAGVEAPASGEACAAWALELRYDGAWGERVMLRAGASGGLDIALDGGEALHVEPGAVVLAEAARQVDDLATARVQALIGALDPLGIDGEHFAPVPYNVVAESLLFVGDGVEVLGAMDRVVAAGAHGGTLYRDAPRSRLVPHGVPILRRV